MADRPKICNSRPALDMIRNQIWDFQSLVREGNPDSRIGSRKCDLGSALDKENVKELPSPIQPNRETLAAEPPTRAAYPVRNADPDSREPGEDRAP